jgi:hypothetical protein
MGWLFPSTWVNGQIPGGPDLNSIAHDIQHWGGNVDAANNQLTNCGGITFSTALDTAHNLFVGTGAGVSVTSGTYNLFFGYRAGTGVTTASNNIAIGSGALASLTGGSGSNLCIGLNAGATLSNGYVNTFLGTNTGSSCTTDNEHTLVGYSAAPVMNGAVQNAGFGVEVFYATTTGSFNSAFGTGCMENNVTGSYNSCLGNHALHGVLGNGNVGIGNYSGFYETGSNQFYLGNVDQGSNAGERLYDLMWGTFNGVAGGLSGQQLTVNGNLRVAPVTGNGIVISCQGRSSAERDWGWTASFAADGDFALCQSTAALGNPFVGVGNVVGYFDKTGNFGVGTYQPTSRLHVLGLAAYANNAAAVAAGLTAGAFYRTGSDPDAVCVVH